MPLFNFSENLRSSGGYFIKYQLVNWNYIGGSMSLNISEDIIQKVKEQNDIVEVISDTVRLKKSGRNYMGLCPFHHEKSPSFSVAVDKQIYKCFGCGEAGNVITFVMKNRNLIFVDAVKFLADRVNIPITYNNDKNKIYKDPNEKLYKINVDAARFFFKNMKTSNIAKNYFLSRGIEDSTIKRFGLGYSMDSWNSLLRYLGNMGYTELDMVSAGLIIKSEKGNYYDRFRNRIIFPVFDYMGKVIGFGGRVLDDSKPKYLNSPETNIFKKGINLYGLNFANKTNMEREIIMVEGYMDCISLHQYGITNVVASLGTALTEGHAKLLKRYADKIIISYDADLAGQNATLRGVQVLKNHNFDVRVLKVPQGKDPDEYIRSNGKEAFLKLSNEALPIIEYRLKSLREKANFNNGEEIALYAKNAAAIVWELNPVEKDIYIKKISGETGIKEQSIYDLLNQEIQKNLIQSQNMNIMDNFGQKLYLEPAYIKAERSLLKLMLDESEVFNYVISLITEEDFILNSHKKLYKLIFEYVQDENESSVSHIEVKCDDIESSKEWVIVCELDLMYQKSDCKRLVNDYVKEIKKFKLEESKKQVMNKIKQYEAKGSLEESMELTNELFRIQKKINSL